MRRRLGWFFSAFATTLIVVGCNIPSSEPGGLSKLSPQQAAQKEKAIAAKDQMFSELLAELTKSMIEKSPAETVAVCKERAPAIATNISNEHGLVIGRTSFKLRNAANAPPEWAKDFVRARVENEIAVDLPNQKLGVLLPIRLKSACLMCHGTSSQIPSIFVRRWQNTTQRTMQLASQKVTFAATSGSRYRQSSK
ncbi:MAG: DUF3365 domain-containing protein [Pirellulaceae bacterium]